MPIWLSILISLAVKFGLAWLLKRFPWIPDEVRQIIEELLKKLKDHKEYNAGHMDKAQYKTLKKAMVKDAKAKIATCYGKDCPV